MAPPIPVRKIDDYSYTLGFSKGYEAADSSVVCWAFGICAVLVIICCFIVLYSHLSRQNDILSRFRIVEKSGENTANGKFFSLLLPLALTICFAGCSVRQNEAVNPAPCRRMLSTPLPPPTELTRGQENLSPMTPRTGKTARNSHLTCTFPPIPHPGRARATPTNWRNCWK